jgi:AraC-like DNA-binding protein
LVFACNKSPVVTADFFKIKKREERENVIAEDASEPFGIQQGASLLLQAADQADISIRHELLHLLDANRNITALIKKMYHEYKREDIHSADLLRIYLLELLLELSRSSLKGFSKNRKMIVLNFIRKKLLAPGAKMPDLSSLCAESGFSRGYLLAAYKSTFNETMGKTLLKSRISHAKDLLRDSDLPVYRICQICGFSDSANFYRVFHRETGCSPADLRQTSK